ncbi:MAG: membrane protein [Halioglobus sp.]
MQYPDEQPVNPNMVTLTYVIYGLHLFSAITGVTTSVAVVTAFLTGWPSLIAVVLNYLMRGDVRGTYLESHFSWQIRTFWYALLWIVIAGLLVLTIIGIPLAWVLVFVIGAWVIYRMLRGVLRLSAGESIRF